MINSIIQLPSLPSPSSISVIRIIAVYITSFHSLLTLWRVLYMCMTNNLCVCVCVCVHVMLALQMRRIIAQIRAACVSSSSLTISRGSNHGHVTQRVMRLPTTTATTIPCTAACTPINSLRTLSSSSSSSSVAPMDPMTYAQFAPQQQQQQSSNQSSLLDTKRDVIHVTILPYPISWHSSSICWCLS
jgi:hypothetical protein